MTTQQQWAELPVIESGIIYTGPNRTHKQCFICKDWKPLGDYYRPQRDSYCKECNKANSRARAEAKNANPLATLPKDLQEWCELMEITSIEGLMKAELGYMQGLLEHISWNSTTGSCLESDLDEMEATTSIIMDCVEAIRKRAASLN